MPMPTPVPMPNGSPTGTCYDAAALGLSSSWFYNWLALPYYGSVCDGHHQSAEFVPMMGSIGQANATMSVMCGAQPCDLRTDNWITRNWIPSGVRYLLGYNEPDGHEGGKCAPADAARDWVQVQALADKFDPPLVLVSPAPVSGAGTDGHGYGLDGACRWLDEFLGNCSAVVEGCDPRRIEYIAMHDYHGNATAMIQRITAAAARYRRKVWLTEFAILDWGKPPPRAAMDAFMREALPLLDASDDVYRYAWFSARNTANPMNGGSNLLPADTLSLEPTSTGAIYANVSR